MEKSRSVYRRGAEDGLVMGPLLAAVVICFGATIFVPMLFVPSIALIVAVPVLTFFMLRRSYAEDKQSSSFSTLWLHGICIFFFGGLIMALAAFAAMRWIWPSYIIDTMRMAAEVGSTSANPDLTTMAHVIEQSIESGNLPTPAKMVIDMLYMAVLTGSILSMFLSLIIRSGHKSHTPTPPTFNS